jgi:hypothetical protein
MNDGNPESMRKEMAASVGEMRNQVRTLGQFRKNNFRKKAEGNELEKLESRKISAHTLSGHFIRRFARPVFATAFTQYSIFSLCSGFNEKWSLWNIPIERSANVSRIRTAIFKTFA